MVMNWFSGSIAEAVQQSKQRNAIFVVFVEGPNDNSRHMANIIDSDEQVRAELESPKFVAINIKSGTEAYTQFAQIYKLVPLPSIFFLGDNGTPLVIATEQCNTADLLLEKIRSVQAPDASAAAVAAATTTAAALAATAASSSALNSHESVASAATTSASAAAAVVVAAPPQPSPSASVEERMERAKQLVEQKRREHEAEQKRLEKERELERRRAGQDLRSFRERQQELELRQAKEERQRDRIAEQERRKQILQQIAQDRAMSAARFANSSTAAAAEQAAATAAATATTPEAERRVYTGNEARLQFRKPDGTVAAHEFLAADRLQTVREYVRDQLLGGRTQFSLASSFPRRLFVDADAERTLAELDLAPTAVILVQSPDKTLQAGRGGPTAATAAAAGAQRGAGAVRGGPTQVVRSVAVGVFGLAQSTFWMLMMPVLALVTYVRGLVWRRDAAAGGAGAGVDVTGAQKRANEERVSDNDAAKRRNLRFGQPEPLAAAAAAKPAGVRNRGAAATGSGSGSSNIHRLRETQDSDDDTNTWNGNSTQQQ